MSSPVKKKRNVDPVKIDPKQKKQLDDFINTILSFGRNPPKVFHSDDDLRSFIPVSPLTIKSEYFDDSAKPLATAVARGKQSEFTEDDVRAMRQADFNRRFSPKVKGRRHTAKNLRNPEIQEYGRMLKTQPLFQVNPLPKDSSPQRQERYKDYITSTLSNVSLPEERVAKRHIREERERELETYEWYKRLIERLTTLLKPQYKNLIFRPRDVTNNFLLSSSVISRSQKSDPKDPAVNPMVIERSYIDYLFDNPFNVGAVFSLSLWWLKFLNWLNENNDVGTKPFLACDFNNYLLTSTDISNNDVIVSIFGMYHAFDKEKAASEAIPNHAIAIIWVKNNKIPDLHMIGLPSERDPADPGWVAIVYDSSGFVKEGNVEKFLEPTTDRTGWVGGENVAQRNLQMLRNSIGGVYGYVVKKGYGLLQDMDNICNYFAMYTAWYYMTRLPAETIDTDIAVASYDIGIAFESFVIKILETCGDEIPVHVYYPNPYEGQGVIKN